MIHLGYEALSSSKADSLRRGLQVLVQQSLMESSSTPHQGPIWWPPSRMFVEIFGKSSGK